MKKHIIGIDTGGTYTDAVLIEADSGPACTAHFGTLQTTGDALVIDVGGTIAGYRHHRKRSAATGP